MYRNKYLIVISDTSKYEYIVNIFENIKQFSEYYSISYLCGKQQLRRYFNNECRIFRKNYKIEFVERD